CLPAATTPDGAGVPGNQGVPAPADRKEENLKVTVVVRTEDGTPIPRDFQVSSVSATGNSSVAKSLDGSRQELTEYRKAFTFPPCRLRVGATAPSFAVVVSPIVNLFAGDPERTIELVLKRGSK